MGDVGAQGGTGSGFRPSVTAGEPSARATWEDLGPPETRGQKVSSCTDYRNTFLLINTPFDYIYPVNCTQWHNAYWK